VALKSDAAAEKPKDQLSRDFLGCSIFDFCNNISLKADIHTQLRHVSKGPGAAPDTTPRGRDLPHS